MLPLSRWSARALVGAIAGLLLAPWWVSPHASASTGTTPATCSDPVLSRRQPAAVAMPGLSQTQRRHVARLGRLSLDALQDVSRRGRAGDDTLWLDRCGRSFYSDPVAPKAAAATATSSATTAATATSSATAASATATATTSGPAGPLSSTFALASNPTSAHTIYLDFVGATVTGTAWNDSAYGASAATSITAPPYSMDSLVDTAFSAAELTQIQRAWLVVAEDYAPYDVNVTTRDPGVAALQRSSAADTQYGVRVIITAHGPIYSYCTCGGLAYVGIYGDPTANAYQPAWVFTDGTLTDGVSLAQAVSHEVGHTLGLHHDGTNATAGDNYYTGSGVWAPIMGASYYAPVTQWSKGEYPLANNPEDDIAVIGRVLGVKPDDFADSAVGAPVLPAAASSRLNGVIGTRTDVDDFTLTTAEATTISAQPTGYQPDLDLSLTLTDLATGRVVAKVDPAASKGTGVAANGLGAQYALPAGPARTYLISIDGVGNGSPGVAGHYSDYGSEGAYSLTVAPGQSPTLGVISSPVAALRWQSVSLRRARVGHAYRGTLSVGGGAGALHWTVAGKLPPGIRLSVRDAGRRLVLAGTGRRTGRWRATLHGTDGGGRTLSRSVTIAVRR